MILGWTVLRPSARERRLWLAAVAATAATSAALLAAAVLADPKHPSRVWSAALVSAAAAACSVVASRKASMRRLEVAVGNDGVLLARQREDPVSVPQDASRIAFVSPWLITLRCGSMLVPIWPDSVDRDAFRRLHACARWAGAEPAGSGSNDDHQKGSLDDAPR